MDIGTAIVAGLAATAVMTVVMYLGKAMDMDMDMPRVLGLMFSGPDNSGLVYALGFIMHFMMGVIFALIYAVLFEALDLSQGLLWGAIFGLIHGIIVGLALIMMPAVHPRMGAGEVVTPPGPFAVNWGDRVPMGYILAHVLFGAVVGAIYL